jgi:uncharacterized protein
MQLDEPLSDKEFNELDQFLLSDLCPEDAMTMDVLHGYLTAIAIGPKEITLAEWLPNVWGGDDDGDDDGNGNAHGQPRFKNDKHSQRIIGLIVRFMNEIMVTLEVAPKEFEPLFCEHEWEGKTLIEGEAWACGFWDGMALCGDQWEPIWTSNLEPLMRPLYLLGGDDLDEEDEQYIDDPVKCHKLAIEIEANIPEIYRFWLPQRKSSVETIRRDAPKVGRNDDCSCGSGKKFKKCCGAEPTTVH